MKIFGYLLSAACVASAFAGYSPHCSAQMRLWGTYYGGDESGMGPGSWDEESTKLAVDSRGGVYVVGLTGSPGDIATPNAFDSILEKPSNQGFLAKFDPNGGLVWATYYGDGVSTTVTDVGTDGNGNVYIFGEVQCPSHELATLIAHDKFCNGSDMFLAKFSPGGKRLWATYYGGDSNEIAGGISVMPSGDVYLIGTTFSTEGPIISNNSQDPTLDGSQDALIAKFNSQGQLLWSRYYGGNSIEFGYDIACKKWGYTFQERCYITGSTMSKQGIATQGAYDAMKGDWEDAFVAQIDGSNGKTLWSTYYGGDGPDIGKSIAIDKNLNVYVGGDTGSKDAIASTDAHDTTLGAGNDVFIVEDMFLAKFDISGQRLAGTYYGTSDTDRLADLDVDDNGDVYLLGYANSAGDFATPNAYDMKFAKADAVMAKFDPTLNRVWGTYYGGDGAEIWHGIGGIKVDKDNRVYVTGATRSSDSISTFGTHQPAMKGSQDAFLVKFVQ